MQASPHIIAQSRSLGDYFLLLIPIFVGIIIPGASIHAFRSVSGKLEQGTLGFLFLCPNGRYDSMFVACFKD